jgi:lipoprotein-releasing system permease protein
LSISLFIARRHLFSKKSRGIINIISMISTLVVAFVTAAMIVVLSAFNGIDELVKNLFSNFDTPLTIVPTEGRFFGDSLLTDQTLAHIQGIKGFSRIIEEDAWFNYADRNAVATVKGVQDSYIAYSPLAGMIYEGEMVLRSDSIPFAIVGLGVRSELYMPVGQGMPTIMEINAPVRGRKLSRYKENAFNRRATNVSGVFSVNAELDSKYVLLPLQETRELFEMPNDISSIEIFLHDDNQAEEVKAELEKGLPAGLKVQSRYEKNALIYKTNASEKWATFLILLFILLIACFNIIAALTMLIIEKKRDIFTLISMGATIHEVRRIFILEGIFINLIGAVTGTLLGLGLCLAQQRFGLITMQGAMVDHYPVRVVAGDVFGIFLVVAALGGFFSLLLVRGLMNRFVQH